MNNITKCIRDDDNKVYCLNPDDGSAIEISTKVNARTRNITDLPEKIARDLMLAINDPKRRKYTVLSKEEIDDLLAVADKEETQS